MEAKKQMPWMGKFESQWLLENEAWVALQRLPKLPSWLCTLSWNLCGGDHT